MYFARGQDAFKKFYADGLCLTAMAEKVGGALERPLGKARGFIGSSHVYHQDMPAIRRMLAMVQDMKTTAPGEPSYASET